MPDTQNLNMWLELNGKRRQDDSTSSMMRSVGFLISYISRFMTLMPGDVVITGTPSGVGMAADPPRYPPHSTLAK